MKYKETGVYRYVLVRKQIIVAVEADRGEYSKQAGVHNIVSMSHIMLCSSHSVIERFGLHVIPANRGR